jgi:hypothetical protein
MGFSSGWIHDFLRCHSFRAVKSFNALENDQILSILTGGDMKIRTGLVIILIAAAGSLAIADHDTGQIEFPEGYRTWFHHHSTVNTTGHIPEGNVGMQHVYANPLAVVGLKTGDFPDGAIFVVDRFKYEEADNHSLKQSDRKVVAVMVRDAQRYAETGGWGFQAFKGGDPNQKAVKDGGKACFVCHIPKADNNFLFTRGAN